MTITGTGFSGATAVSFGGVQAATFSVASDTQITAVVPSGAASGPLAVTTPGGTAISTASFTVIQAPTLVGFLPISAAPGSSVILSGTGFSGASAVRFNGTTAGFSVDSDTQITATVPSGATSGLISVSAPGGTATSVTSFTVTGTVTPQLTLAIGGLTSGAVTLGNSLTFTGTVTPTSLAGSTVTLTVQRLSGSTWIAAVTHTATVTSGGTYSNGYKPSVTGSYRAQASIAASASHGAATTAWQGFTVK